MGLIAGGGRTVVGRALLPVLLAGLGCWCPPGAAQSPQAEALYRSGRFEEARTRLEAAYAREPGAATRRLLGLSYFRLLDYQRAWPLLAQSLDEQPTDPAVRRALAEVELELGRPGAARAVAEPLLDTEPGVDTWYLWGRIHQVLDRPAAAEAAYRQALAGAPPTLYQTVAVRLSRLYLARGEPDAARELAREALARQPDGMDAETLRVLAVGEEAAEEPERALDLRVGYRLEYDDNAALAPDRGAAVVDQSDSGDFRHRLYVDALARRALGGGVTLFGEAHLNRGWHQDLEQFDFFRQYYVASLGWDGVRLGARLPVAFLHTAQDGDRVLRRWRLTPGAFYRFSQTTLLYGFLRLDHDDYANPGGLAAEDRSGDARSVGALLRLTSPDRRGQLRAMVEYGNDDTDGANWDRERLRLYLYGSYQLNDRLLLAMGGEYLDDDYDNRHDLLGQTRDDQITTLFGLLSYRLTPRWVVQLQWSHQTADSNLAFYDYDRTVISAGINWRF